MPHKIDSDGSDIFRYTPFAGYFASIGSFIGSVFFIYGYIQYQTLITLVWSIGFPLMTLFGIYMLTLRIRFGNESLQVCSLYGDHITPFNEISTVIDKKTGKYRTLYVKNKRDKRVLTITSSYVNDYDQLVYLLKARCSIPESLEISENNFKGLKLKYKILSLTPVLGVFIAIALGSTLEKYIDILYGIVSGIPFSNQDHVTAPGWIFLLSFVSSMFIWLVIVSFFVMTYLKITENLSYIKFIPVIFKGNYPSHWYNNDQA